MYILQLKELQELFVYLRIIQNIQQTFTMKADGAAFIIFLRVILLIYIEAIEDTVMACISNNDLKKIIINEPECNAFF